MSSTCYTEWFSCDIEGQWVVLSRSLSAVLCPWKVENAKVSNCLRHMYMYTFLDYINFGMENTYLLDLVADKAVLGQGRLVKYPFHTNQ